MRNVLQRSPRRESECAFEVAPSDIVSSVPLVSFQHPRYFKKTNFL